MMPRYEALAGFLSRDIIDREIGQICERLPQILEDNTIIRKTQGRYRINGREVSISLVTREAKEEENWIDSGISSKDPTSNILDIIEEVNEVTETPFEANHEDLVVRDGPLTQPFLDYVFDTGQNETYAIEMCPSDGTGEAVSSMPLASEIKGGKLQVEPGDRLEAMSLAWNSIATDVASLGELPAMPLPPPLPKSSEPAQPSAGVPLAPPENLWLAEKSTAERAVRIVMDLPIVQSSRFACDPTSLCAPEACIIPETIIESPKCTMGPHFASTTKPSAEGIDVEIEPGPVPFLFGLPTMPVLGATCTGDTGEKRRHRFNEVLMPGELEQSVGPSQVDAQGVQIRCKPPSKPSLPESEDELEI